MASHEEFGEICGYKVVSKIELIMAGGGSHAWEYVLYDCGALYIHNYMKAEEFQYNKKLVSNEDGHVKMVDREYECIGEEYDYYDVMIETDGFNLLQQQQ